jgi:Putative adhesin
MRFRTTLILFTLLFTSAVSLADSPKRDTKRDEKRRGVKVEKRLPADGLVSVWVCIASGSVKVNGWDHDEVRARSVEAGDIELRRKDDGTGLAKKIEVRVKDKEANSTDPCEAYSELELDVPHGATVQLQTRDTDIEVAEVAVVYASTQNGDVHIERATRIVDAGTIGGGISLRESTGRVSLHSASGSIDATDVKPAEAGDSFDAKTLGGDITLDQVTYSQLSANTLNGGLCVTGPLVSGGRYNFRTMSGDMTLTMPENSSFQLSAKFSQQAEIITDFPITILSQTSAKPAPVVSPAPSPAPAGKPTAPAPAAPATPAVGPGAVVVEVDPQVITKVKTKKGTVMVDLTGLSLRRLEGIHGTGGAKLELASFSGTIRLQKQ